ncbi:hypothetical protein COO91_04510 [Nostoc flagelliforme CCNUN1]|uniref:Uncharacterized protein n=1 Tax=Nostoc flagelliforme CCNUN1 TaxID=2038116 RepID=A0A2K8ST65_9NOSO|nr:hypothetical protein COO91_04510 [Nostoc flagelliforme CCNUN1]
MGSRGQRARKKSFPLCKSSNPAPLPLYQCPIFNALTPIGMLAKVGE